MLIKVIAKHCTGSPRICLEYNKSYLPLSRVFSVLWRPISIFNTRSASARSGIEITEIARLSSVRSRNLREFADSSARPRLKLSVPDLALLDRAFEIQNGRYRAQNTRDKRI